MTDKDDKLVPVRGGALSTDLRDLAEETKRLIDESVPANTREAYRYAWQAFVSWCDERDLQPLPADPRIVAMFLAWEAEHGGRTGTGLKISTLELRIAAINKMHSIKNLTPPGANPHVKAAVKGIKRRKGADTSKKRPLVFEQVCAICDAMGEKTKDVRDRAMLLIGWAGAFRSDELLQHDVEHVKFNDGGLVLFVPRSKTDTEARGKHVVIPRAPYGWCPVDALEEWLTLVGDTHGPLWRALDRHGNVQARRLSYKATLEMVKSRVKMTGLNPDDYGSHSLRAGFVTDMRAKKLADPKIMRQTGHARVETLSGYDRPEDEIADSVLNDFWEVE